MSLVPLRKKWPLLICVMGVAICGSLLNEDYLVTNVSASAVVIEIVRNKDNRTMQMMSSSFYDKILVSDFNLDS